MEKIVECVPNFSEGKDKAVIDAIAGAIAGVEGIKLLNVDPGADFHRTVFTFVGGTDEVVEAAFQGAKVGLSLIDMTKHKGEHGRMGALDVCPFIPIKGVTFDDCTELAKRFGQRMWDELGVPGFLYAKSAQKPERVRLPDIRKGEYEALEEKLKDPEFKPDFGEPLFVPRSGTFATGTRQILIAYNVNLNTNDKGIASTIAGRIRTSGVLKKDENGEKIIGEDGRPVRVAGYLKAVQGGGMRYNEDIAQISMNLLDFNDTNMHEAYEACRKEAKDLGADVTGSEIVGLVPEESLIKAGEFYAEKAGKIGSTKDELVDLAMLELGLDQLYKFDLDEKVIDRMVSDSGELVGMSLKNFMSELSSSSPAPGGGSVAALSGSLGASLIEMVCNLTIGKEKYNDSWEEIDRVLAKIPAIRMRLLELVDEDTNAFNDVMAAFRMPKETEEQKVARSSAIQKGYKRAIATPLETASKCLDSMELSGSVAKYGNPNSITDVGVGVQMAATGLDGAIYNVRINLSSIKDEEFLKRTEEEIKGFIARKDVLLASVLEDVENKL